MLTTLGAAQSGSREISATTFAPFSCPDSSHKRRTHESHTCPRSYPKGAPMVRMLLLCVMLFQAGPQTALKPMIDNERVVVWDVTGPTTTQPFDAVVVSLSSSAAFFPKG